MIVGEADHAPHGGEGLLGEVARGVAPLGPGQGTGSDAAAEQDVSVVGAADIAVLGSGGVLVAPGLAAVDGDALAPRSRNTSTMRSPARTSTAADVALRRGCSGCPARPCARPTLPTPSQLARAARSFASKSAGGSRRTWPWGYREAVELAADGSVHGVEGEEWWRSASRMRVCTILTQPSTSPLSVARPERAGSTAIS